MGLSTGQAAAALLGTEERLEYTLVGDTVNLSQRLQQLAESGETVLSQATMDALAEPVEATLLPEQLVKGRDTPVRAWRIARQVPVVEVRHLTAPSDNRQEVPDECRGHGDDDGGVATAGGPTHDVLVVEGVRKTFEAENAPVRALRGATLRVPAGDFVALMGPSGCGKSTLLNLVAGLDVADEGTIRVGGELVTGSHRGRAVPHPSAPHRHRVPVLQPAGEHDGAGERGPAGHHRRPQAQAGREPGP